MKLKYKIIASIMAIFMMCILPTMFILAQEGSNEDIVMDYTKTIYNEKNGAYSSNVYDVVQGSDGTLYIANSVGLISYNGRNFKKENGSKWSQVNKIFIDGYDNVWVGTSDCGLVIWNRFGEEIYDKTNTFDSNCIHDIVSDNKVSMYVATNGGLYKFDRAHKFFRIADERCNNTVSLASDNTGVIAGVTGAGGVYFLESGVVYAGLEKRISQNICTGVSSSNGNFYFYTYEGDVILVKYNSGEIYTEEINVANLNGINNVYSDGKKIWVLADNGIGYITNDKFKSVEFEGFNGYFEDMYVDYEGNYWIASSKNGLLKLCPDIFKNLSNKYVDTKQVVNATYTYQGCIYAGMDKGLAIWNIEDYSRINNELTEYLNGIKITGIANDSEGNLWFATYGSSYGAVCYTVNKEIVVYNQNKGMDSDSLSYLTKLKDGSILTVSKVGICIIKNGIILEHYSKKECHTNSEILDAMQLSDGSLLLCTDGEGIVIVKNGNLINRFGTEEGLASDVVRRIIEYNDGYILVTASALCYMKDMSIQKLDFSYAGLYDAIVGAGSQIWILGNAGIFEINISELIDNNEAEYRLYNYDRGFENTITLNSKSGHDSRGNIYMCCQDGVTIVSMVDQKYENVRYNVNIDAVYADDKLVSNELLIEIPSTTKKLEIKPAFSKFGYDEIKIEYYLEGYDDAPIVVDFSDLSESIIYNNLPGGDYTFKISLLKNSGREVIDKKSVSFTKKMAWYEKTLYRNMMFLVAILVIFLIVHSVIRIRLAGLEKKKNMYRNITKQTIMAIVKTIDAKDEYTNGHSIRVANYSVEIGRRYGMSKEQQEDMYYCGLLHDIGKIGIPDDILKKTSGLTDEEFAEIKKHPLKGAEILSDVNTIPHIVEGAKYHHEKYDGTGYCEGLRGEQIPMFARIIAVADTFDAMTSSRCYRKGLDEEYVVNELARVSGKQLDPKFVKIMLEMIKDGTIKIRGNGTVVIKGDK